MTLEADRPKAAPSAARPTSLRRGHRLGAALLGIPLVAAGGWLARRAITGSHDLALAPPVPGERIDLATAFGRLALYAKEDTAPVGAPPLLLIHSVNAAASAYEIRPIYERIHGRAVYAIDLPGYGFSDRRAILYTPRLMTDAILAAVTEIRRRHAGGPVDALALSLSCEFLARAASDVPEAFRSLAFVSPTGFDRRGPRLGPPGSDRGMPKFYRGFTVGLWRRPFFDLLTTRVSIRYFLEKTFGSKAVPQALIDYDYRTTHQPGAEHAPFSFISGFLFSNDITRVYESLSHPIWLVHGTRGDFQDYSGTERVKDRLNWRIDVLPTGALPQFETPDDLVARLHAVFAALPSGTSAP